MISIKTHHSWCVRIVNASGSKMPWRLSWIFAAINAWRLLVQISTTVYSQLLIQLSELERCRVKNMPRVSHDSTGFEPGFTWLRVQSSTTQPLHSTMSYQILLKWGVSEYIGCCVPLMLYLLCSCTGWCKQVVTLPLTMPITGRHSTRKLALFRYVFIDVLLQRTLAKQGYT